MLKSAAFRHKKNKSICTQTWIKKNWVNLFSYTKVNAESTASSQEWGLRGSWWLCHPPPVATTAQKGLGPNRGLAGLACHFKRSAWIIQTQTHTPILPATSLPFCPGRAKKEFALILADGDTLKHGTTKPLMLSLLYSVCTSSLQPEFGINAAPHLNGKPILAVRSFTLYLLLTTYCRGLELLKRA